MRRFTWIALSFFLITATIAITAQVVRAQIIFPDNSVQDTAFSDSGITVAPGAAFVRTLTIPASSASGPITPDLVPAGKELVVLKLVGYNVPLSTLDSRLPSPNQNTGPITLAVVSPQSSQQQFQMEFPTGTVVIAAGRLPWLSYRNGTTFAIQNSPAGLGAITLIGFLRPTT
jgi:hypothetical protein